MKISMIKPAPWNTRQEITPASVATLAASIAADGLIQPISVCDAPDGNGYICYDGNRRLAAAKSLGWTEIPTNYCDCTIEEAMVKTVTANLQREDDDPLLAAAVIAGLKDEPEVIASKLGKTTAWVRRRAKLNALIDEIKAFSGKVTLEVLERLSDFAPDQQAKLVEPISNRVKWSNGNPVMWRDIRYDAERLSYELDAARFDKTECAKCTERTGADWFAEDESGLGRCLNYACFNKKCKAHHQVQIDAVIGDAESVKIDYAYMMPSEVMNDGGNKRTKAHPCAWYYFDADDRLVVKWGPSKKVLDAEAKAKAEKDEARREMERMEREIDEAFEDEVRKFINDDESEAELRALIASAIKKPTDEQCEFIMNAVLEELYGYHDDYAEILRAFPAIGARAELEEVQLNEYLERHPETDDEGE